MLGIGIWILADPNIESSFAKFNCIFTSGRDVNICLRPYSCWVFIFITGFCGCCGAMRESAWMIAMYIGCVVIVLVAELVGGIYIAVERSHVRHIFAILFY
ncbi:hypothetical protein FSP39_017665 [Pinctada imbricata]|uniref:Uncharacterized protein n=1 Tax=Pinctada imbricata TaxID=66713 RepID=A0AA89CB36_PINIB|nr:hypothetical protein FSP39_017665 [Pinctada imbricata]